MKKSTQETLVGALFLIGLILLMGSAGARDHGNISQMQYIVQSVIALAALGIAAYLSNTSPKQRKARPVCKRCEHNKRMFMSPIIQERKEFVNDTKRKNHTTTTRP